MSRLGGFCMKGQWGGPGQYQSCSDLIMYSARLPLPDLAWIADTVMEFNHIEQT